MPKVFVSGMKYDKDDLHFQYSFNSIVQNVRLVVKLIGWLEQQWLCYHNHVEGKRSQQRVEKQEWRDEGEVIHPEKSEDGAG